MKIEIHFSRNAASTKPLIIAHPQNESWRWFVPWTLNNKCKIVRHNYDAIYFILRQICDLFFLVYSGRILSFLRTHELLMFIKNLIYVTHNFVTHKFKYVWLPMSGWVASSLNLLKCAMLPYWLKVRFSPQLFHGIRSKQIYMCF